MEGFSRFMLLAGLRHLSNLLLSFFGSVGLRMCCSFGLEICGLGSGYCRSSFFQVRAPGLVLCVRSVLVFEFTFSALSFRLGLRFFGTNQLPPTVPCEGRLQVCFNP